ncbi:MAG TPA: EamA family transporter [Planctomycetaceae bacterium]|nr:EamA family transporter [Planctomycetaceae bacterium]
MHEGVVSRHSPRGRLLLLSSAVLWSTSGLLVKSPPLASLPAADRALMVALFRALIAGLCLVPFVAWRRARFHKRMLPMIVSFAAMNFLFVAAMTRTTAAAAIFLQYTATGWAFLFGALFLKERVTRENLLALGFGLAGIAWIVGGQWDTDQFAGIMLALGSGLAYGGVIVSLRALHEEDSAWLVVLNHLVSALVLVPWLVGREILPSGQQWTVLAVLGVFQMGLPYVLFARGVATVPAQEAGLITLLEAILNPFWVWLFWGEEVAISTWLGGGLILAGLLVRYVVFRAR